MHVLKAHLQTTLRTLLASGASQRQIEKISGIDRKTIRSYAKGFAAELVIESSGHCQSCGELMANIFLEQSIFSRQP